MSVQRPTVFEQLRQVDALVDQRHEDAMVEERLPFTVRVVHTEEDLRKAVTIRHMAYARHMPEFAEALRVPEEDDGEDDTVLLLAESKLDGSTLGSVRIQTNHYRTLNLEQSIRLPSWLSDRPLGEFRRLAVAQGTTGRLVKMVMVKACLSYCQSNGVEWGIVAARPPLNRGYQQLTCVDVLAGETFVPLPRTNNVPHHVMGFDVVNTRARLTAANHPLLNFFCNTYHPDIDLGGSVRASDLQGVVRDASNINSTRKSMSL